MSDLQPMKCPFYGFHLQKPDSLFNGFTFPVLMSNLGNECPLRPPYAPCLLEVRGKAPDWEACPFNRPENSLQQEIRSIARVFVHHRLIPFSEWEATTANQ